MNNISAWFIRANPKIIVKVHSRSQNTGRQQWRMIHIHKQEYKYHLKQRTKNKETGNTVQQEGRSRQTN